MKMDGEGDDKVSTETEWDTQDMLALNLCILGGENENPLVLAGLNKHFNMMILLNRIHKLTNKKMDRKVVWDKINYLFDIDKLDKTLPCPFPNETCEFSLPEKEYGQLMQDKLSEVGESKDSESGRETPPIVPMARRATSQASSGPVSNKRKSSASEPVTVTESGRRSTTATPTSSPTKAKRRI